MGVNIILYDNDKNEIKEWDSGRIWYDRDLFDVLEDVPQKPSHTNYVYYGEPYMKILNYKSARDAINNTSWEEEAKKRYLTMLDLLEKYDGWLFFSW